ncbi:MAG TPA: MBL fold metallo-hydrolase [Chlamydiales bacterium]|nr:MBL fold metallo-hydrolase [Chlamydiales bacterium]
MNRFFNPHCPDMKRSLWNFFLWKIGHYDASTPHPLPPKDFSYPALTQTFDPSSPSAIWIGHATFLIEIDGFHILTDPVWDEHCSPIPIRALKRKHEAPIALGDLPPIDCVLLSHNHYDHLDAKTVAHLHSFHPNLEWIVPIGLKRWFHRRGIEQVTEVNWWQAHEILGQAKITAVPSQHFSGRSLWDKNKSLWNGYVLERNGKRLYFTGDTGYNTIDFKAIGSHFPHMDLSLIPIGTYLPRAFMSPVHCSPWDAVEIHKDVKSRFSLGMHWKTFRLSEEPLDSPPYDLFCAMQEKNVPFETFLPIEPGTQVNW